MKRILWGAALLLAVSLGLSSCAAGDVGQEGDGGFRSLTFSVNIPDAASMTRARWLAGDIGANLLIDNMQVLVFDANGFISRHTAAQGGGPAEFTVNLPMSSDARVLHFVCNYDQWSAFDDRAMAGLNEAMVLANMAVEYPRVTYWNRTELSGGITGNMSLGSVQMMRNVAKISVVNNSAAHLGGDILSHLTDMSYVIGNYYDRGTVTLFDKTDGTFSDGSDAVMFEAAGAALRAASEDDFATAHIGNINDAAGESLYTYERRKSAPGENGRMYLILRARYHEDETDVTGAVRYYKIDIAMPPPSEELYDIRRNHHYVITIGAAIHAGYASFPEAVTGLSLNNFATSIEQSYSSVSNGVAVLNIEYVNRTFVVPGAGFEIRYSYMPDGSSGATDNSGVVGLVSHTAVPAIALGAGYLTPGSANLPNAKYPGSGAAGSYLDRVKGNMVGAFPVGNDIGESSIRISKGGLARTIILKLRRPFSFEPVAYPSSVGGTAGVPFNITLNIPEELDAFLPFQICVRNATMLMPVSGSGIYFEDLGTSFRYRYTVTHTGVHTLRFCTGSTTGNGNITVCSELFDDKTITVNRS